MIEKKHFVLVHGFCLGAWCWYKLAAALKSNGSRVTALDLDGSGARPDRASSFSDYVRPLIDFLASLPDGETVILVGHSYGGIPISAAMEDFPAKISLAVFLTAYMPNCTDPPAALIQEVCHDLPLQINPINELIIFIYFSFVLFFRLIFV